MFRYLIIKFIIIPIQIVCVSVSVFFCGAAKPKLSTISIGKICVAEIFAI